jgi:hypothetical protein
MPEDEKRVAKLCCSHATCQHVVQDLLDDVAEQRDHWHEEALRCFAGTPSRTLVQAAIALAEQDAHEQSDKADYWHDQFERVEAERDRLAKRLAAAWSSYLDIALDARLDDGTPMLEVVFATNPELRKRLVEALHKPDRAVRERPVWTPPTAPEADPVHRPDKKRKKKEETDA